MESHKRLLTEAALIAATGTDMIYHTAWTKLPCTADGEIGASNLVTLLHQTRHGFSEDGQRVRLGGGFIYLSRPDLCKSVKVRISEYLTPAALYWPKTVIFITTSHIFWRSVVSVIVILTAVLIISIKKIWAVVNCLRLTDFGNLPQKSLSKYIFLFFFRWLNILGGRCCLKKRPKTNRPLWHLQ